ncbi:leucyl aminopeptidase [Candidatus Uhrbacteria bacterium]|nr:MAG: leucyl aminopeptidase [Candidatus Uhrbacteria bacterium]
MEVRVLQGNPFDQVADLVVLPIPKGKSLFSGQAAGFRKLLDDGLVAHAERRQFEGGLGDVLILPTYGTLKAKFVAFLGAGERGSITADTYRRLGALCVKKARELKLKSVAMSWSALPSSGLSAREAGAAFVEGAHLAAYGFHAYHKRNADRHAKTKLQTLTVYEPSATSVAAIERGFAEAAMLAEATCLARDLVNTPSQDMTPAAMADVARELAASSKRLSVKLFDRDRMERMKMHAALAVARGSEYEPVGVHLTYKPQTPSGSPLKRGRGVKRIAVVGKAVTFDSGGLSLKPADGMTTMKIDMAGAASVLGLFKALPELAPNVEVHGIFLAVENMPSGKAYRPGDVVRAMNGTTIEILNTDAEGRVVLADALSYAATLKPDAIVDLATLTGACVVALGEEIAGLMGTDRKLLDRLKLAAEAAGEAVWELPMPASYEDHVKSKIADIKNTGAKGQAGAIAGAMFLKHFVPPEIPWAHLDIAGPSYTERETRPDQPPGASGFGVRLLARYLQGL